MIPRTLVWAVLLLGLVASVSCGGDDGADVALPPLPTGWEWYVSSQHGYRVGYPETWDKDTRPAFGLTSFVEPSTGVGIHIGVGATRQTNLTTYLEANKISTAEGATYLHEGPITINGVQGFELILTLPSEFYGRIFRPGIMKHRQVVFLSRGKAYVMTATAFDDEYNEYSDIFDSFVASFIIPKQ